jgi:uroporphyrin-III C-methyltransferase/precorrin-2 dehydrogenase/sirohydrochlorin ferrochelatase
VATTLRDLSDCINQLAIAGPATIFVGLDWAGAGLPRPDAVELYRRRPPSHTYAGEAIAISAEAIL